MNQHTTSQIRAIIVDDEMPARENLRYLIEEHCPEIEVMGVADGVKSALTLFSTERPDLIFLDIRMPSGTEGFDLLEQLRENAFYVVFVTAFKDHAIRAFENRALHYILKPIDEADLRETVDRLLLRRQQDIANPNGMQAYRAQLDKLEAEIARQSGPGRFAIHHSKGMKIVEPATLSHLEGQGNCTLLHFRNGDTYLDTRTLKVYESLLGDSFFRIHKSYMIQLSEVSEILHGDAQSVVLKSGISLPLSRDRKKEMILALNRFLQ